MHFMMISRHSLCTRFYIVLCYLYIKNANLKLNNLFSLNTSDNYIYWYTTVN